MENGLRKKCFFSVHSSLLLAVNYFCKEAQSYMFDRILNMSLHWRRGKQPKEWQRQKFRFVNLMTYICFTNHQERQVTDFLKKYPCIIYTTNYFECKVQKCTLEQNQKYLFLDTEIQ